MTPYHYLVASYAFVDSGGEQPQDPVSISSDPTSKQRESDAVICRQDSYRLRVIGLQVLDDQECCLKYLYENTGQLE